MAKEEMMKKIHIGFLLFAFALSGCMVSVRPDVPVAPAAPPPPPPEVVETPMASVEVVEQEPAPEIVFNEPVYYPPPLVVRYTYDHWMYVVNGPFVDIVFIDHHGIRHVEHWRQGGARMTLAHLPEWHRSYHVPGGALQIHNERLREYAIRHPGSVRHPPAPAIRPTNLPVNKINEAPVQTRKAAPPVKDYRISHPAQPEPKTIGEVKKPATVEQKPITAAKPATTVQQKPSTVPKETGTLQQRPTTVSKAPTTVQQKPATASKQPPNVHENLKTVAKKPIAGQEKKTTVAKKPNKPEKKSNTLGKKSDSDSK